MANRSDIVYEFDGNLDGNGKHFGTWLDSGGTSEVVANWVTAGQPGACSIEEALDSAGNSPLASQQLQVGEPVLLTARFFRVTLVSGSSNSIFRVSVRRVN